jgi:hypothetical protein
MIRFPNFISGNEALLIYFVGTLSFCISLVSVLNDYLVRRNHIQLCHAENYLLQTTCRLNVYIL